MKMSGMKMLTSALVLAALAPQAAAVSLRANSFQNFMAPGNTSEGEGKAALPVQMAVVAEKCKCRFIGLCTCAATIEFMDCVADACASGACTCQTSHFFQSCTSMSGVCPGSGLHCTQEKATCQHTAVPTNMTTAEIKEELAALRCRKCRLLKASKAGFMNADNRLKEIEPVIQGHMDLLKLKGCEEPVYMGCDKAAPVNTTLTWIASDHIPEEPEDGCPKSFL